MAETIRVGIIGAGRPGALHAKAYQEAGGFKLVAVTDLIPARRRQLMIDHAIAKEYASAAELIDNKDIDAVSVCLPNHLHADLAIAALKAGKHVLCESPPAMDVKQARRMEAAAARETKVLLYAMQRRYGPGEQAAKLAISKGFIGGAYHVRASWTRSRAIPVGTGWYTDRARSGGGAMIDLGAHMLDLAWHLLGEPKPLTAFAVKQQRFADQRPAEAQAYDVEDAMSAILSFEGNLTVELAVSWAMNQPPAQNGSICRVYGSSGAIEVYTPEGAVLYRDIQANGQAKATPLKSPKTIHLAALVRHFKECIHGKVVASPAGMQGAALMAMVDGIYKSCASGKSADVK